MDTESIVFFRSGLQASNPESFLSSAQRGILYRCVFLHACVFTCETEAKKVKREHREAACVSEKYCVRKACDCVRVCLNYLANVPTEEWTRSGAHCCNVFPLSIHPSISTPYTNQPSSSSSSSFFSSAAEPLVRSACLNKQELSNKRFPSCY